MKLVRTGGATLLGCVVAAWAAGCYCPITGRDQCIGEYGVSGSGSVAGLAPPFEIESCDGTNCGTAMVTTVPTASGAVLSDGSQFWVGAQDAGTDLSFFVRPPWSMLPGASADWSITLRSTTTASSATAMRHTEVVDLVRNCGTQHCPRTDLVDFGRLDAAP